MKFHFEQAIKNLGIKGTYFVIDGLRNKKTDIEFAEFSKTSLSNLKFEEPIELNPILMGFRDLHMKVNCTGKRYISSPENLVKLFKEREELPNINLIVDIYNFISLKSCLAIGAHDIRQINGDVRLAFTEGTETFLPLGYSKTVPVKKGEYCYLDDSNDVLCRLEVRQVEKTKVVEDTTCCFYIVQGNAATSSEYIKDVAYDLITLTQKYCGGKVSFLYTE